jgi:integrative and conjugative element protein (TIGR02256 family)
MISGARPGYFLPPITVSTEFKLKMLISITEEVNMEKIYVVREALDTMLRLSRNCETETGGILAGTTRLPLVFTAGEPGPNSIKSTVSFQSDPDQDREELRRARDNFNVTIQILGYWHKHPSGLKQPSHGDLIQARRLLASWQALGGDKPWLLSFIIQDGKHNEGAVYPYLLDELGGSFRPLQLAIVEQDEELVKQALQKEPLRLSANRMEHPWIDPTFRFHQTPAGRLRLEEELKSLKRAGFKVKVQQKKSNQRATFLIEKDGWELLCVFPVEYPLGIPRFFQLPTGVERFPLQYRPVWNSDLMVVDYVSCLRQLEMETPFTSTSETPAITAILRCQDTRLKRIKILQKELLFGIVGMVIGIFLRTMLSDFPKRST